MGMGETADSSLLFLVQQKQLSALLYLKYAKFPQASIRINYLVRFIFLKKAAGIPLGFL